jgi:hypothetical protein
MPGAPPAAANQTTAHASLQKKPGTLAPPVYRPAMASAAALAPYPPNVAVTVQRKPETAVPTGSGALNGARAVPGVYWPQALAPLQRKAESTAPPVYRPAALAPAPLGTVPTIQMARGAQAERARQKKPPVARPYVGRRRANRIRQDAELEENLRALIRGDTLSEEDTGDGDLVPGFNMYSLLPVDLPQATARPRTPVQVPVTGPGVPLFTTKFGTKSVKMAARDYRIAHVTPIWEKELARPGRTNQQQLKKIMEDIRLEGDEPEIKSLMKTLVDLINNPTSVSNLTNVNAIPTATATNQQTVRVGPGASARVATPPKFPYTIEYVKRTKYGSKDHFWPSEFRDPHLHYYGGDTGKKAASGHCKIGGSEYKFGPGIPLSNANIDAALLAIQYMPHIGATDRAEYNRRLNDKRR